MEKAYLGAVDATLAAIRKVHDEKVAREKAPAWLEQYFADVDAMRLEAFVAHHAPAARVVFGNNPAAVGLDAIRGAIGGFWDTIAGLSHGFRNVWEEGPVAIVESAVTYHRKDGESVVLPCVSIVQRDASSSSRRTRRSCRIARSRGAARRDGARADGEHRGERVGGHLSWRSRRRTRRPRLPRGRARSSTSGC